MPLPATHLELLPGVTLIDHAVAKRTTCLTEGVGERLIFFCGWGVDRVREPVLTLLRARALAGGEETFVGDVRVNWLTDVGNGDAAVLEEIRISWGGTWSNLGMGDGDVGREGGRDVLTVALHLFMHSWKVGTPRNLPTSVPLVW